MIIGLHGHAGVGKNAAARALGSHLGFRAFSLTAPIRKILLTLDASIGDGWTVAGLVEHWGWSGALRHPVYGREVRRQMVASGRALRQEFGEDVLVNRLEAALREGFGSVELTDNIVITDVRLPHEAAWVLSQGGLVLSIQREGTAPASSDITERPLPEHMISFTISGGSDEEIATSVLEAVSPPATVPNIAYTYAGGTP
mgnify:CR=1 FL=1